MVDRQFADSGLASLYDLFCSSSPRGDFAFYMPLVMAAGSVLDVGCGTGALLHGARDAGHTGRLVGLDPAAGMLEQACTRTDIEWIHGDLASRRWEREFELVVMSGHAFQVFVEDKEIRSSLTAIRSGLTATGRFAFETRNPDARAWETWTPDNAVEVTTADGTSVRMADEVETPCDGRTVSFTTTFSSGGWTRSERSRSTLRFLDAGELSRFLSGAGFAVEEQFGDWDRRPFSETSPEIITIARPV